MPAAGPEPWRIVPLSALPDRARVLADIDAIFYVSSATQAFASDGARAAFRERWLGRYLHGGTDIALVAVTPAGRVIGYIVGAVEDPAQGSRFADIPTTAAFAGLSRDYPAHLHVNTAPEWRSNGVGAALIARLAAEAKSRGADGLHLVTGAASKNRAFYAREGFTELGRWGEGAKEVVFLAKRL